MILDVGCGYLPGVHQRRGGTGIDLNKGFCDVQCDATMMPFKDNVFHEIHLIAVLEHIDQPLNCLKECARVARHDATIHVRIPREANNMKIALYRLFLDWPFGFLPALRLLWRHHRYKGCQGWLHAHSIKLTDLEKFLIIEDLSLDRAHWTIPFNHLRELLATHLYPIPLIVNINIEGRINHER